MGHRAEEWRWPGESVVCPGCSLLKPPEEFYSNRSRNDGRSSYCKPCTDQKNARATDWRRVRNLERRLNPEERAAKNAASAWGRHRRWRHENADHVRAYARLAAHQRRAAVGFCSEEQEQARWDYYGGRCWMCGEDAVEMDHVIAVTRGGSNWPANLRPACRRCNAKKHNYPLNVVISWANSS